MKKLLSMLLVLTMVLSMMGGLSVFASEDAETPAETIDPVVEEDPVVEDEPAEEEEPADLIPIVIPLEDLGIPEDFVFEAEEPETTEPIVIDFEEEEVLDEEAVIDGEGTWTEAAGFVDGQDYVIGVKNADDTYTVLQISEDGATVTAETISDLTGIKASNVWAAAKSGSGNFGLSNGTNNLYPNDNLVRTKDSAKWYYAENKLYYTAGGGGDEIKYLAFENNAAKVMEMTYQQDVAAVPEILILTNGAESGTADEPPSLPYLITVADSLTAGLYYVIGFENADGSLTVLEEVDSAVKATKLDKIENATDSMKWLAADGLSLENAANAGHYLTYDDASLIRKTGSSPKKWSYSEGIFSYDSKGTNYYLVLTEDAASTSTEGGSSLLVWDVGLGSVSSSGGGSSSSTYTETADLSAYPYIVIVDTATSMALGLDKGSFLTEAVTVAGEGPNRTVTPGKGLCIAVTPGEGGYALTLNDPPDKPNYLYVDENGQIAKMDSTSDGVVAADYAKWKLSGDGKTLSYNDGAKTWYLASIDGTFTTDKEAALKVTIFGGTEAVGGGGGGEDDDTSAFAPVVVTPPEALPYVLENSGYSAPELSIVAAYPDRADYDPDGYVPEGTEYDPKNFKLTWTIDGAEPAALDKVMFSEDGFTSEITLNSLLDLPTGLYNISCTISCDTWTPVYKEENNSKVKDENGRYIVDMAKSGYKTYSTEYSVSFTVCKGILENSLLTFSDVHETWNSVGQAIANTIIENNGLIPALILCTGDWINGHGDPGYDKTAAVIDRFYAQVSGIDIVFLTGNHETGSAATDATKAADLGGADFDGVGQVYDADYESESVGTSAENDGLVIFGINYDSIENSSYESILPELEAFFEELEKDYRGELVIISCHSGLHVLGVQPESTADKEFGGDASYNIDDSDAMVELINKYADTMDIMYFFGHDHSKGEEAFLLQRGDKIISTVSYSDRSTREQTLGFTYGHAGYIGEGAAGSNGRNYYTLVRWDGETITRTMTKVSTNEVIETLTATINRVAEQPAPEEPGDGGKPAGPVIPDTGDDSNIVLWAAVMVLCMGALAVVLPRKKHN